MQKITTTDFADFAARERFMAEQLLRAARQQGFPVDFYEDEIRIMLNLNSGFVFFTNSEFQVCMLNGDRLEMFYSCPICGEEGFLEEIMDHSDNEECQDWLKYL